MRHVHVALLYIGLHIDSTNETLEVFLLVAALSKTILASKASSVELLLLEIPLSNILASSSLPLERQN
jgi:hypothetical protein